MKRCGFNHVKLQKSVSAAGEGVNKGEMSDSSQSEPVFDDFQHVYGLISSDSISSKLCFEWTINAQPVTSCFLLSGCSSVWQKECKQTKVTSKASYLRTTVKFIVNIFHAWSRC